MFHLSKVQKTMSNKRREEGFRRIKSWSPWDTKYPPILMQVATCATCQNIQDHPMTRCTSLTLDRQKQRTSGRHTGHTLHVRSSPRLLQCVGNSLNGTSGGVLCPQGSWYRLHIDCTNSNSLSFRFSQALHNLCAQMEGLENSVCEFSDRSCVTWVSEAKSGAAGYGCQWQFQLDLLARFSAFLHVSPRYVSPSPFFDDHRIMYRSQRI